MPNGIVCPSYEWKAGVASKPPCIYKIRYFLLLILWHDTDKFRLIHCLFLTHFKSSQHAVIYSITLYLQHIIESVSHLLNPVNRPHWMVIQETEGGTAELMALLEMFAATIARTSQSFNYTPQFSVISPNISKTIHFIFLILFLMSAWYPPFFTLLFFIDRYYIVFQEYFWSFQMFSTLKNCLFIMFLK